MTKAKEVTVKQSEDAPIPTEVLASSIVAISEGIKKLRSGRLNDRALHLLIQHAAPNVGGKYKSSPISIAEVRAVLEGMASLESTFIKPKKK